MAHSAALPRRPLQRLSRGPSEAAVVQQDAGPSPGPGQEPVYGEVHTVVAPQMLSMTHDLQHLQESVPAC